MKRFIALVCAAVAMTVAATPAFARDNAVMESRGYYLTTTTTNRTGTTPHGALAPVQTFELVRPEMASFRIGRVYTSCPCVELSSPKKAYARGERAIFELVNVKPTPPQGHTYALYVQVTSPVRATLRFDTFMQTGAAAPAIAKPEEKKDVAENAADKTMDKIEDPAEKATQELDEVAAEAAKEAEAALAAAAKRYAEKEDENPYRASTSLDDFGRDGTIEGSDVTIEEDDVPLIAGEESKEEEKVADKEVEKKTEPKEDQKTEPKIEAAVEEKAEGESLPPYAVDQRIGLITLGVSNLDRSRAFYESLGWKAVINEKYDGIVFFQLNGQILALYPLKDLLEDQNRSGGVAAPGGITLAINVREKDQVDKTYLTFLKAGATSLKAPAETSWGAITSYVADPDGHPWEITWAPQMAIDEDGELWIK